MIRRLRSSFLQQRPLFWTDPFSMAGCMSCVLRPEEMDAEFSNDSKIRSSFSRRRPFSLMGAVFSQFSIGVRVQQYFADFAQASSDDRHCSGLNPFQLPFARLSCKVRSSSAMIRRIRSSFSDDRHFSGLSQFHLPG